MGHRKVPRTGTKQASLHPKGDALLLYHLLANEELYEANFKYTWNFKQKVHEIYFSPKSRHITSGLGNNNNSKKQIDWTG